MWLHNQLVPKKHIEDSMRRQGLGEVKGPFKSHTVTCKQF